MQIIPVDHIFEHYPQCIVHPVSCAGLNHDILSKQLKKSYPDYFRDYTRLCLRKKLDPEEAYAYSLNALFGTQFITTLTIKNNWQEKIQPKIIHGALDKLFQLIEKLQIKDVAIPKINEIPYSWLQEQILKRCDKEECSLEKIYIFG
jgi:hypothetical protein